MTRVLVSDKLSPQGLAILEQTPDLEVDYAPGLDADELLARIPEVDGLVIRSSTKVTRDVLDAAPKLQLSYGGITFL